MRDPVLFPIAAESGGEAASPPMELRRETRIPTDCPARLVWADLTGACSVRVKDISQRGARLTLPADASPPRALYLMLSIAAAAAPVRVPCELRWRVGDTVGVMFSELLDAGCLAALQASVPPLSN